MKFKNSIIYAFEPHPEEYRIHQDANKDINWIQLDYDGQANFYLKQINSGIHSIRDRGKIYGTQFINIDCSTFLKSRNLRLLSK